MAPAYDLPEDLPLKWEDALKWARTREGYRASIKRAIKRRGPEVYLEIEERIRESGINKGFALANLKDNLDKYFDGLTDFEFKAVSAIIRACGAHPEVGNIAPFDILRHEWIREDLTAKEKKDYPQPLMLDGFGMKLWRMQPMTLDRVINGFVRRWDDDQVSSDGGSGYHVSLGGGLLVVLSGRVGLRFLGQEEPVIVEAGHAIGYRLNWPHRVFPVEAGSTSLEFCASSRGAPADYFISPYTSDLIGQFPTKAEEKIGQDSPRHLVSHALASCRIGFDRLATFVTIPDTTAGGQGVKNRAGALKKMIHGVGPLTLPRVLDIAHALRMPESHFFTPLHEHLKSVHTGPFPLVGPEARPGKVPISIPTEIHGRKSWLEVSILKPDGPDDEGDVEMLIQPEMLGERLLVVLEGELGVGLFGGRADKTCTGVLARGDCFWIRPGQLAHGFWVPSPDKKPTVLDVRIPYRLDHHVPWGREL